MALSVPHATAAPIVLTEVVDLDNLVETIAEEHHVSASTMKAVIQCESQWNITAVGDNGESLGLVQIHLPDWPEVTEEQAYDPEFAITFLAEKLSEGKGRLWTCYRMLFT